MAGRRLAFVLVGLKFRSEQLERLEVAQPGVDLESPSVLVLVVELDQP